MENSIWKILDESCRAIRSIDLFFSSIPIKEKRIFFSEGDPNVLCIVAVYFQLDSKRKEKVDRYIRRVIYPRKLDSITIDLFFASSTTAT